MAGDPLWFSKKSLALQDRQQRIAPRQADLRAVAVDPAGQGGSMRDFLSKMVFV
jgi:hypothetical protein